MPARNRAALTDVLLACSYSSMWQLTSRTSFLQNSACSSPTEADGLWFVICFSFWTMSTPGVVGLRALTYKNFEASDTIPERSHMCDLILICCVMGNNFHMKQGKLFGISLDRRARRSGKHCVPGSCCDKHSTNQLPRSR